MTRGVGVRDFAASRASPNAAPTAPSPARPRPAMRSNKEQAPQPLPDPDTADAAEPGSHERIAGDVLALLVGTPAGRNGALLDPTDASRSCAGDGLDRRRDANRAVSRGV